MLRAALLSLLLTTATACTSSSPPPNTPHLLLLVPGAAGDRFSSLRQGLSDAHPNATPWTYKWGAPSPLFLLNFQTPSLHAKAESRLADLLTTWRHHNPTSTLSIITHSAGGGVLLGALARTDPSFRADTVLLLAPSVSPTYDLAPALSRLHGRLHAFSSTHDTLFLRWRTSTFGTYDNLKTPAAGHLGFDPSSLPPDLRPKLVSHPYDPSWSQLHNDGSHFGPLSRDFARQILAPLLRSPAPNPSPRATACDLRRPAHVGATPVFPGPLTPETPPP